MVMVLFEDLRQTKKLNGLHSKQNHGRVNGEMKKPELGGSGFRRQWDSGNDSEYNKETDNLTISQSLNFRNKEIGESMQNLGFIKIPRSLFQNAHWQGMRSKYQKVFLTILFHTSHKKKSFSIGENLIEILPGQFCTSIRNLMDLCNEGVKYKEDKIDKNIIERAVSLFTKIGFVRQEVRHKKSILTITYPGIYDEEKKTTETATETRPRHDRDIKEEDREREEEYMIDRIDNACARIEILNEDEKKEILSKEDLYSLAIQKKTDWTRNEIEYLFDRLNQYPGKIRDLYKFCEKVIENYRRVQQAEEFSKKKKQSWRKNPDNTQQRDSQNEQPKEQIRFEHVGKFAEIVKKLKNGNKQNEN